LIGTLGALDQEGTTMRSLGGRVAVITGAGRGIGREHALLFAREGARVVVNDTGAACDGSPSSGPDPAAADAVVDEIVAAGGEAVASHHDVADWEAAEDLVRSTVAAFGGLDILVNNAGILRDRQLVNMTEAEWDDVVRVHLKGHVAPSRFAAAHWREEHKAGRGRPRHLVNTSSTSGLLANPGQTNYGSAKSAIATFTQIAAKELARYDVTVNAIVPAARTRLTLASPGLDAIMEARDGVFDEWSPANVAPLAVYLSSTACAFTGEVFFVQGGVVRRVRSWEMAEEIRADRTWEPAELAAAMAGLAGPSRSD
jgi:NAD(P)-dependent dehydrogenase (short-subunit alcohol dehydrogenase family)